MSLWLAIPTFEEGRLALARLLSETVGLREAIELLGQAGSASAKAALAAAYLADERYDEARALLEEAVRLEPENTRALALLGPIYGRAGDFAMAARTLEKAVALGETSPEIRKNLALVYVQQGKLPRALAELQKASEDAPSDASIWFALGNAYLRGKNGAAPRRPSSAPSRSGPIGRRRRSTSPSPIRAPASPGKRPTRIADSYRAREPRTRRGVPKRKSVSPPSTARSR